MQSIACTFGALYLVLLGTVQACCGMFVHQWHAVGFPHDDYLQYMPNLTEFYATHWPWITGLSLLSGALALLPATSKHIHQRPWHTAILAVHLLSVVFIYFSTFALQYVGDTGIKDGALFPPLALTLLAATTICAFYHRFSAKSGDP